MKVLVCGDRNWTHVDSIYDYLKALSLACHITEVMHGCARGADQIAGEVAEGLGIDVAEYPAEWDKYGKRAGMLRNRVMLDMKPDLVVAFHNNLAQSRGTKDCVNEARKRGIKVVLVTHTEEELL